MMISDKRREEKRRDASTGALDESHMPHLNINKNVQGANAILCDELIMLVGFDSVWKKEL